MLAFAACAPDSESPPARPEPPAGADAVEGDGGMLAPLDLIYVCGNTFILTNSTRREVHLTYRVVGTDETGGVTLPDGIDEDPGHSETELTTKQRGALQLYQDGEPLVRRPNLGQSCGAPAISAATASLGSADVSGQWTTPFAWPIVAIHLHLMPDGRVISWSHWGVPQVWDPATGVFTPVPSPSLIFCSGETFLADGRLFVAGGHISDDHGLPDVNVFSPGSSTWTSYPPMKRGRWYPTATTLPSGEVLILAGRDEAGTVVGEPEIWSNGSLRVLSTASRSLAYYPRVFVAPNGKVFLAGETQYSRFLKTSGTGAWSTGPTRLYGTRDYGAAVMYERGKVLYVGGGRTTNTAETIDLNAATPTWKWTGSMATRRRHLNATMLPTGEVLVTGGVSGTGFNDITTGVHAAEVWNPSTGVWTTLASSAVNRGYHATSILLPDGRVLHSGSGEGGSAPDEKNAELFSPPYLFKGARPTITSAPSEVAWGSSFSVATPDAAGITKVSLIRIGATTHAFDMNQRFQWLSFSAGDGTLAVTAPASANDAPPGHYMLFLLNAQGVPSVGSIIKVGSAAAPVAPTAEFTVSCTGLTCTFTDKSTDSDGVLAAWNWAFGDGGSSTSRNPSYTYGVGGTYSVVLTATDNSGLSATRTHSVTAPPAISLSVTARQDSTTQYFTLLWSGAKGTMVDVYRNGAFLKNTENDGKYVNSRNSTASVTFTYKVCEAGTTTCSNDATVKLP